MFSFAMQFIIVNNISHFPEKGITDLIIVVSVIVQNAIMICINGCGEHKLYLIFEIDDISNVGKKAVSPTGFVEHPDVRRYRSSIRPKEKEFRIAVKIFC